MTIHVLTYPDRWIDRLKYQIWGTMPSVAGDYMSPGSLFVEVIKDDTCTMVPTDTIVHIYFDSGYHDALARNRKETNENIAARFQNIVQPEEDGEMPYAAPANPPSMYDYS